jgi:hypothetical protein
MTLPTSLDTTQLVALAAALGWASGLRLYAVVFFTGLAGWLGWVQLPSGLQVLQHPLVLGASGLMLAVEFFADKIPGSTRCGTRCTPSSASRPAWRWRRRVRRRLRGWATIAALLGGTLAATSHAAKATTRAAVNTSPEPFSNIALSLLGDAAVPAMLWLACEHPCGSSSRWRSRWSLMVGADVAAVQFLRALVRRCARVSPDAVGVLRHACSRRS